VTSEELERVEGYRSLIRGIAERLDDRPQAHTRLASRLGVHRNTIGNAVHGNRFVGADVLVGLAREVGLTLALTEAGEALDMTEADRRRQRQRRLNAAAAETLAIQEARIEAIQRQLEEDHHAAREIFRWLGPRIRGWAEEQ
jgi:plasmid maintenance system antidote protein VapI